jgi:flagellar basal body-associated protein FliL
MDIVGILLIGAFVLFALVILILAFYLFFGKGASSVKFEKKIKDGKSVVVVEPFVDLKRVIVQDKAGGENLVFVRENVPSNQRIVFEYAASNTPARLTTEGKMSITLEAKP